MTNENERVFSLKKKAFKGVDVNDGKPIKVYSSEKDFIEAAEGNSKIKPGRPKEAQKRVTFVVNMPIEMKEQIDSLSKKYSLSKSSFAILAIRWFFEELEKDEKFLL